MENIHTDPLGWEVQTGPSVTQDGTLWDTMGVDPPYVVQKVPIQGTGGD